MTTKSLLILGALGLASVGIASAKSYDIVLTDPAMVGTTQLHPGEYKLKVEGNQAIFTDVQNSQTFTASVKVENANAKFDDTRVESTHQGDMDHINRIDLGGSTTQLAFDQQ